MLRNSDKFCLILLSVLFFNGCYVIEQGAHHFSNYFKQIPLQKAIEDPENAKFRSLLKEIPIIKKYAQEKLLLKPTDNYTTFLKIDGEGITYNVTASDKTQLKPYTWCFPVIGCVPYKGYFEKEKMEKEKKRLADEGYDVWHFPATAYSTLGYFRDPVNSIMLRGGLDQLTEAIFHEMTHETFYINNEGQFNEQLASFVGEKGTIEYLITTKPNGKEILRKKNLTEEQYTKFLKLMKHTYERADSLYKNSEFSEEKKISKKSLLFAEVKEKIKELYPSASERFLTLNNARLLQFRRYDSRSPIFEAIWAKSKGNWKTFWKLVKSRKKEINERIRTSQS